MPGAGTVSQFSVSAAPTTEPDSGLGLQDGVRIGTAIPGQGFVSASWMLTPRGFIAPVTRPAHPMRDLPAMRFSWKITLTFLPDTESPLAGQESLLGRSVHFTTVLM